MPALSSFLAVLPGARASLLPEVEVRGLAFDSRRVEPGDLFFCLRGWKEDGHRYAEEAWRRGAVALVVEEPVSIPLPQIQVPDSRRALGLAASFFYGHPSRKLRLLGVTGTNGKTTVTHLLRSCLEEGGRRCAVIGTVGYFLGEERLEPSTTTPDPVTLHSLLARWLSRRGSHVALELSSHALDQERAAGLELDVAIFHSFGHDHLDYHRDRESYLRAKRKIFSLLEGEGPKASILNADDRFVRESLPFTRGEVITFGFRPGVQVQGLESPPGELWLRLHFRGEEEFRFPYLLPGRGNRYNALAAVAASLFEGVSMEKIARGLGRIHFLPGRFEVLPGAGFQVVVDFAHNPEALRELLAVARAMAGEGRVILVFGCEGGKDRQKRPLMGRLAAEKADRAILTLDNVYGGEPPEEIFAQVLEGVDARRREKVEVWPHRGEAIARALSLAGEGDVVVVAGKGHEDRWWLNGESVPFDDREAVRSLLRGETPSWEEARLLLQKLYSRA